MVWCWLIAGAGCTCLAFSVAELASAYPTCGGLYYTVSRLAPEDWSPSISWVVGWINLLGQVAGVASTEYGSAQILLAAGSVSRDFQWYPTINQTAGVIAALTVVNGLVNSLSTYWIEKMTKSYVVVFHFAVLISCAIALLAKADSDPGPWNMGRLSPVVDVCLDVLCVRHFYPSHHPTVYGEQYELCDCFPGLHPDLRGCLLVPI